MTIVTVSRRFRITLPRAIREALGIVPGQKVRAWRYGDRIELIPVRAVKSMRGFLAGIDPAVPCEGDGE